VTDVLHIITGLGMGGAERMLVQIAGGLQARNMQQHVVTIGSRGAYAGDIEARGVPVTELSVQSIGHGLGGLVRLARLIAELRPRVLQGWMYHGNVLAAAAHRLATGRDSRRLFWNLRASNMDDRRYGWLIRLSAIMSRWPDVVLANSEVGMNYHLGRGFRPRLSRVIPNGIDTELFRPDPAGRRAMRGELGIASDAVVALHVARVDPMKDHATFLAAMQRLPSVTGILIGIGTKSLKIGANVRALGPRRDVAAYCACADLTVSTSAFGEGFSNALAEGMSAGLVPIATDVGDARLIVGNSGRVIPPGDVEALVAAIAAEASLLPAERTARGQAARAAILEKFTIEKCIAAYLQLYAAEPTLFAAADALADPGRPT
jgi:glycosyltransferase involved in cell wall biosynthesis